MCVHISFEVRCLGAHVTSWFLHDAHVLSMSLYALWRFLSVTNHVGVLQSDHYQCMRLYMDIYTQTRESVAMCAVVFDTLMRCLHVAHT